MYQLVAVEEVIMTANQIAAQSERELERHNVVVEEETERHNKATEDIQDRANKASEFYNQERNRIQEEYNRVYMEYQNADLEHKKQYEDQLALIKDREQRNTEHYREQMVNIERDKAWTDKDYKMAVAAQGWMDEAIKAKEAYYTGQKTEAYIVDLQVQQQLERQRIENEKNRITREYNLGLIDAEQRDRELQVKEDQIRNSERETDLRIQQWEEGGKQLVEQQVKNAKHSRWQGWLGLKNQSDNTAAKIVDSIIPGF